MNAEQYRKDANRTRSANLTALNEMLNSTLGLCGEAGEVAELIKKAIFHGKDLDPEKLKLELGDVLFYLDWLASVAGLSLQEIADANIEKLKKRYPDGWVSGGGLR